MQDLGWRWKEEPFHMLTGSPAFPYALQTTDFQFHHSTFFQFINLTTLSSLLFRTSSLYQSNHISTFNSFTSISFHHKLYTNPHPLKYSVI